jgi:hypothetical protein
MPWSERSVRDHKRQTDCAIHRAYAQLASDQPVLEKFNQLLHCTRKRAKRLFEAPVRNGQHAGVDALVNLARFHTLHLRPAMDWPGTPSSWRPAITSLAHHLVCAYAVPQFLTAAWYATDALADTKRGWFVAHASGASFRSLNVPIPMTRKMEHLFLASKNHLPIEYALRKAELLALGTPPQFTRAILATPLATDLRHGEFWRTVWLFFIANASQLNPTQIGPIIDYLHAVRHETASGFKPPYPDFSMKGRTVQSILRLMGDWHKSLGKGKAAFTWAPSPFRPLSFEEPAPDASDAPRQWQIMELTNSAQLRQEGMAMHHCVASYAHRCYRGQSSIWSLRFWQREKVHQVLTIEVDPTKRSIIQARGNANRAAAGKSRRILEEWATREGLKIAVD